MVYFIAFTLGISGVFHPCFIGTITTFYATLALVENKKKFILGNILGIISINFLFLFFADSLSHLLHQRIFDYIIGGLFIIFGLMFLGVIKHRHVHSLLSVEKIKRINPVFMGFLIVISWVQSFFHIFIPMIPIIANTSNHLRPLIILPYIIGLTIPIISFNFFSLKLKKTYIQRYTRVIGFLLVILGIFITFNIFEKIEHMN